MTASIRTRALEVIATSYGNDYDPATLQDGWRLDQVIELDTVDCFDFFGFFCEPFGVLIPDDAYDRFQTIGQFISWLEANATVR